MVGLAINHSGSMARIKAETVYRVRNHSGSMDRIKAEGVMYHKSLRFSRRIVAVWCNIP
jgi:hypothetical protein